MPCSVAAITAASPRAAAVHRVVRRCAATTTTTTAGSLRRITRALTFFRGGERVAQRRILPAESVDARDEGGAGHGGEPVGTQCGR